MSPEEGLALLEAYSVTWPRADLSDETRKLWAQELRSFYVKDGRDALADLGRFSKFPPSLAELLDAINETRKERLRQEEDRMALPAPRETMTFSEFLATRPDMKARVLALKGQSVITDALRYLLEREHAGLPSDRVERIRQATLERLEAEKLT